MGKYHIPELEMQMVLYGRVCSLCIKNYADILSMGDYGQAVEMAGRWLCPRCQERLEKRDKEFGCMDVPGGWDDEHTN